MNKNTELLESFQDYCIEHPEERFWQALRNWAGVAFIYAQPTGVPIFDIFDVDSARDEKSEVYDTFYWEGKNEATVESISCGST